MKVKEISVIGRNTQGVRLISLESAEEKVTGISKLPEVTAEEEVAELAPEEGESEATPPADETEPTEE
jgi:DNA gyrase subunit A